MSDIMNGTLKRSRVRTPARTEKVLWHGPRGRLLAKLGQVMERQRGAKTEMRQNEEKMVWRLSVENTFPTRCLVETYAARSLEWTAGLFLCCVS